MSEHDEKTAVVSFSDVSKSFGKQEVLKAISLGLPQGRINHRLIGPSGCGKMTLVNLIVSILAPTKGVVTVLGEQAPFTNVRNRIGFMSQSDAPFSRQTDTSAILT